MVLKPIDHLLCHLEAQPEWQTYRQLRKVLELWHDTVGSIVAEHTQPIAIRQGSLQVATANHLWAQNLMFERVRILNKLNAQLQLPLQDIRFSTARWQQSASIASTPSTITNWQEHPSFLAHLLADSTTANHPDGHALAVHSMLRSSPRSVPNPKPEPTSTQVTPQAALESFHGWARLVQQRSYSLPLCPQCHCPTPQGELQRWMVCALCATKTHHAVKKH